MAFFIETERLMIREPSLGYLNETFLLRSDPDVMFFIADPRSLEATRELLEVSIRHQEKHGFSFGFVLKRKPRVLSVELGFSISAYDDSQPEIGVGYRFNRVFWNKGYATEVTAALLEWGFHHLSVDKLVAMTHPENERSKRVLEKVGMSSVGRTVTMVTKC